MSRTTRSAAMVAAAAATALLVTSCGSSGGDEPKKAQPKAHAVDINAQPVSKLKDGGTLRVPLQTWITQHNYFQVDGSQADNMTMNEAMMPHLYHFDGKGVPSVNKDYLLSVKDDRSSGKQVLTYTLNPKAKWSDGKSLSWKDFEALWKALGKNDPKYQASTTTGYEDIDKVERGADDHEVKVTMKRPLVDYQLMFEYLWPAKYMSTPEGFDKGYLNKVPVTAGPFKMKTMDKGAQSYTLVRDPKWWGAKPKLDKIIFRVLSQDAAVNAYLNHELDMASVGNAEYYKRVVKDKKTKIHYGLPYDQSELTFNKRGLMADKRVRQAVETAVDNKQLAKIASKGLPITYPVLGTHFQMPNQVGYQNNAGDYGSGDAEKAKKLLQQAGFKPGKDGIMAKGGKKLSLEYVLGDGSAQSVYDRAEATIAMWRKAGIKVTLKKVPANDFLTKEIPRGSFDITGFRWLSSTGFSNDSFSVYRQPKGDKYYQNYGRVGSAEVDAKYREAMSAKTKTESNKITNELDKLVWDEGHSLPQYQTVQVNATPKNLANYGSPGFQTVDWTKVGWMQK